MLSFRSFLEFEDSEGDEEVADEYKAYLGLGATRPQPDDLIAWCQKECLE